ncbi:MAG: hypothetical protein VX478_09265 [Chloroflexota bacterium]|jgi:hypothetical protein|nr:hypothetical protein [Chloroflexota bacterium]MQF66659.1 hypothetical protein [SAR202 cluster bacterium AC-647-P02_OGT_505m]|tara:strand:+ start:3238 stop:3456 length:219 start_codon:yes stop_codon:yes gene_type:complete
MKPAVDRLEAQIKKECRVVRIDIHSDLGIFIKDQFGTNTVPTFLLFNSLGTESLRKNGVPTYLQVMESLGIK